MKIFKARVVEKSLIVHIKILFNHTYVCAPCTIFLICDYMGFYLSPGVECIFCNTNNIIVRREYFERTKRWTVFYWPHQTRKSTNLVTFEFRGFYDTNKVISNEWKIFFLTKIILRTCHWYETDQLKSKYQKNAKCKIYGICNTYQGFIFPQAIELTRKPRTLPLGGEGCDICNELQARIF